MVNSCEEDAIPPLSCKPTLQLPAFLESYPLVVFRSSLKLLELIRLGVEFIFCYSPKSFAIDHGIMGDFSHGDSRISLDSILDHFAVPGRVGGMFSLSSRAFDFMPKLLKTLKGLGCSLSRHIVQTDNFRTVPKLLYFCLTF